MKTHPGIHWFWILTLLLAVPAPAAETARQIYRQALVQENGADDPAAALALYEQAARAAPAGAALAQAARWRAALCLDRLGRRAEAADRLFEVLAAPGAADRIVRENAARALWRMAQEESAAGGELAPAAAEWLARLQEQVPELVRPLALDQAALRRVLRGRVDTWDGRRPVNASVRIQARPAAAGPVEARSTWRTQTAADGTFSIELPVGRYDLRMWAPACGRAEATAELTPEEKPGLEIRGTLPRIRLPAEIARVELVGSFLDDWEGVQPLEKTGPGLWETRRWLGPGRHEYKFRVNENSRLITDVAAAAFVADAHDDFNAVLELDREQEVVFRFDENDPHFEHSATNRLPASSE